jgi:hypothetical protein
LQELAERVGLTALYPNLGQTHLEQKVAKLVCRLMRNGFVDNESDAFNAPSLRSVAVLGMSDLGYKGICSAASPGRGSAHRTL